MQGESGATAVQTRFSADGYWWWDGTQWRPAMSDDRLWRWTGSTWVAVRPASGPGAGSGLGIIIAGVVAVVVLVAVIAIAVIYFAGPEISNVFSNLVAPTSNP